MDNVKSENINSNLILQIVKDILYLIMWSTKIDTSSDIPWKVASDWKVSSVKNANKQLIFLWEYTEGAL